jgi:hypothetical protein
MLITLAVSVSLAIGAIALYVIKHKSETRGNATNPNDWQIGPIIGSTNYSTDLPLHPLKSDGIFSFSWNPKTSSAHYVTYVNGPIVSKNQIRMKFRLEGDRLYGTNCSEDGSSEITVYLQRSGDDWSGTGKYETYRWWATFASTPTKNGDFEIIAPFDQKWTSVETSNSIDNKQEFLSALSNCERIGFTFANCTGYGHGASSIGNTKFTLLEWIVE